ncbi:hypothetical protein BDP55DRAFT_543427 [Colletotrichum godetiae]|uniref:Uncharacterized protein n=1 Tax=Colletotrichum godetiae TaxID=1209918 RepID=A0AAJ0AXJ6_9PEZI|nr:uncharacterized protein BDP55DRAFT_543427 [Colletotrichum godetiae]KAK1690856.1 hypothetical protein BDP55DRAFT_543427 [Colletotrichum godetiae]
MILTTLLPLSLLATASLAKPILPPRAADDANTALNATSIIAQTAPKSTSCDGVTSFPEECATASHVASYLPQAFQKYNIYSKGEMAAVLSLMAFETGDFRYNRNHFPSPGRPGQGTRNLQMAGYNLMYALSIPELASKATEIAGGVTDGNSLTDDKKNQILDLVLPDDYTWGSAAWFLATQCDDDVKENLAAGTVKGFTLYMGCIGTSGTEDRVEYWSRAKGAFGVA